MNSFPRIINFCKYLRTEHIRCWRIITPFFRLMRFDGMSWNECETVLDSFYKDRRSSLYFSNPPSSEKVDLQIVVPVYNAEKTLTLCIDSILSQKTQYSYEITIVNDGSTDNSLAIAQKYISNSHIKIINQKNGGLSAARNTALKCMNGRYILFLDSDDCLTSGSIESLMSATKLYPQMDIIQGGYHEIDMEGNIIRTQFTKDSIPELEPLGYPWGKVIKCSVFENIHFPEGYWFEDTIFSLYLYQFFKVGSISFIVYEYRQNPKGIVHQSYENPKVLDTFYITRCIISNLKESMDSQDYYEAFLSQVLVNKNRVALLNNEKVSKSVFYQTCSLKASNWPKISTQRQSYFELEQSLLYKDYLLYSIV